MITKNIEDQAKILMLQSALMEDDFGKAVYSMCTKIVLMAAFEQEQADKWAETFETTRKDG